MKAYSILIATLAIFGCGDGSDRATADVDAYADDITLCSCTNESIDSDAKARACAALIESMPAEEVAERTVACRAQMASPAEGPDVCFCMKTMSQDPEILQACDALISDELTPSDLNDMMMECAN